MGERVLLHVLVLLLTDMFSYENPDIALNCGSILRECIRHEPLAKTLLYSPELYKFFTYVEVANFDTASDAFASFKVIFFLFTSLFFVSGLFIYLPLCDRICWPFTNKSVLNSLRFTIMMCLLHTPSCWHLPIMSLDDCLWNCWANCFLTELTLTSWLATSANLTTSNWWWICFATRVRAFNLKLSMCSRCLWPIPTSLVLSWIFSWRTRSVLFPSWPTSKRTEVSILAKIINLVGEAITI